MLWIHEIAFTHIFQISEDVSSPPGLVDDRDQSKLEEQMWDPECPLTNKQIDQFLVVARYFSPFLS